MEEQLKIIQDMIEKTRIRMADSGIFFILWGWLVLAACLGQYLLVYLSREEWIGFNWFGLMGLGFAISIFLGLRKERKVEVRTYSYVATTSLWQACGSSMALVAFVGFPLGVVPVHALIPIMAVISGIGTFVTGRIVEWKPLQWAGLLWWTTALGLMGIHWHYHSLALAVVIIPAYLVPGYLLRREYQNR